MLVGINYPWIDYAWDFGDPPAAWVNPQNLDSWRADKRRQIAEDFRQFSKMGLFAVRWFILADGLSYGIGDAAPRLIDGEWTFDPLPAEHPFRRQLCDDFEFVLKTCADLKIKFVPSLIDFHWCHLGTVVDPAVNIVKGGRWDIVCDKAKRIKFFDNVLEPLLEISMRYPDSIYAWELINEPEWVIDRKGSRGDDNKTVPLDAMMQFIASGAGRINEKRLADGRPAFRSTVGFAHWDTVDEWDSAGLGLTLHQFHYYAPDRREIPLCEYPPESPCFIGEFATTFHRGWPDLTEQDMAHTIRARLRCMAKKGYTAAFLWSARATDEATTWTNNDQEETVSFINIPIDDVV